MYGILIRKQLEWIVGRIISCNATVTLRLILYQTSDSGSSCSAPSWTGTTWTTSWPPTAAPSSPPPSGRARSGPRNAGRCCCPRRGCWGCPWKRRCGAWAAWNVHYGISKCSKLYKLKRQDCHKMNFFVSQMLNQFLACKKYTPVYRERKPSFDSRILLIDPYIFLWGWFTFELISFFQGTIADDADISGINYWMCPSKQWLGWQNVWLQLGFHLIHLQCQFGTVMRTLSHIMLYQLPSLVFLPPKRNCLWYHEV